MPRTPKAISGTTTMPTRHPTVPIGPSSFIQGEPHDCCTPRLTPATFPPVRPLSTFVNYEWEGGHVTGAKHITLSTLADRLAELPAPGEDFYVICHGGGRSNRGNLPARMRLRGPQHCGGTSAWFAAGLPMTSENGEAPAVVH